MQYFSILVFSILSALTAGKKLDLSWKGLTKESFFRDINGSVSTLVEEATELDLRGNFFDSFIDCAGKLDKLEVLDLSLNNLTRFFFVCNEDNSLYKLNVSHNRLPFLNESALTKHVTKLQLLDLSFNIIQFLKKTTFQHLVNLKSLSLSGNPINSIIEPGTFQNLTSLIELNLSNISTSKFPRDLFTPLISLHHLSLASNPLEVIPALPKSLEWLDISETNIIRLTNMDYPRLKTFIMDDMPFFEFLDFNDFKKIQSLTDLSIRNCDKLTKISASEISGDILPQIMHITIKNCSVVEFDNDVVSIMKRTALLDLQDNPWQCDCSLNWIFSLNSTNNFHDHMRCASPATLKGKRVFEIPREEFECSKINYLALSSALCVIFVSAILITVAYLAREQILKRWRLSSRRGDTVTYKYMTRDSNDGEKILDQCDLTDYP